MSPESGDGIQPPSPEFGQPNSGDQSDRNPAIWPDLAREPDSGQTWPERPDPGRPWPERSVPGRPWPERPAGWTDLAGWPGSGHFRRNPAIPDSDETVRIPAFISNSGYISRNQVKIVRILSISDRISSSMIFILFYINIFML
jgi:hypothetical protein